MKIYIILFSLLLSFLNVNSANIEIIGCINNRTYETRLPNNNGNCYYGRNWQNIMLPGEDQMKIWREVFKNNEAIVNRLPIVNFESGFNENAENSIARGYVQTLKAYNIPKDIKSQLVWMRNRQEAQKKGNCSHWWEYGSDRVLKCLYARHYGARTANHWYVKKAFKVRNFYIDYFNKNG